MGDAPSGQMVDSEIHIDLLLTGTDRSDRAQVDLRPTLLAVGFVLVILVLGAIFGGALL